MLEKEPATITKNKQQTTDADGQKPECGGHYGGINDGRMRTAQRLSTKFTAERNFNGGLCIMDSVKKNFDEMNAKINQKIAENGGEFKATIVFMGEWGGVGAMPVKIYGCEPKGYAQYKNGIDLTIKKKGGRNGYSCRLYESKSFAIFDGWHEPEKETPMQFSCFDKKLFYETVDSVKAEKIAEQSERLYAQERESKPKTYIVVGAGNGHIV